MGTFPSTWQSSFHQQTKLCDTIMLILYFLLGVNVIYHVSLFVWQKGISEEIQQYSVVFCFILTLRFFLQDFFFNGKQEVQYIKE
jgi:hypothetical protein